VNPFPNLTRLRQLLGLVEYNREEFARRAATVLPAPSASTSTKS